MPKPKEGRNHTSTMQDRLRGIVSEQQAAGPYDSDVLAILAPKGLPGSNAPERAARWWLAEIAVQLAGCREELRALNNLFAARDAVRRAHRPRGIGSKYRNLEGR